MSLRLFIWCLVAAWALAYAVSVWYFAFSEPTGDGFARGLNRLMGFLGWQLVAGFVGGLIWVAGRQLERSPALRWLLRLPALLALILFAALAALMLYARIGKPPPAGSVQMPVTQPAKPLDN